MKGAAPGELVAEAVAWDSVPGSAVALDVVYAPRDTPFLARAVERGLTSDHGLGMLARQGALAFELWLGIPAPIAAMLGALART
jgi:shikimate dehydrogenase